MRTYRRWRRVWRTFRLMLMLEAPSAVIEGQSFAPGRVRVEIRLIGLADEEGRMKAYYDKVCVPLPLNEGA